MVTFDLGEGRELKGAVSGEIALYFCTPEGHVFDILPALQSPAITLQSIEEAMAFYQKNAENIGSSSIKSYHKQRIKTIAASRYEILKKENRLPQSSQPTTASDLENKPAKDVFPESRAGELKRDVFINTAVDEATKDMRFMVAAKTAIPELRSEPSITVVEPGGKDYYRWQISKVFHGNLPPYIELKDYKTLTVNYAQTMKNHLENQDPKTEGSSSISGIPLTFHPLVKHTPAQWKSILFEGIMKQELKGGNVKYNSDSLEAIHILEE